MHENLEKLLAEKTFSDVRQYFSDGITKKEAWSHDYDWVASAAKSTDLFVSEYLEGNLPAIFREHPENRFDPCLFEEHVNEASRLLDSCLVKRKEIQDLETDAITTALEYLLAESLQPGTLSIAKVELKANRSQANASGSDADENVLVTQDHLQTAARKMRMTMHRTPNNPLNFGERIDFLRGIYADNVLAIYERLYSARLGLEAANIVIMRPVSLWTKNDSDNLSKLIYWVRDAIRAYEHRQLTESVSTEVFRLGGIYPGGITALRDFMALDGRRDINFILTPEHFKSPGTHRILKIGIAVSFKNNSKEFQENLPNETTRGFFVYTDNWLRARLREMSFPSTVKLPLQSAKFTDTESYTWSKKPLRLESEVAVWNGFPDRFVEAASQFKNANPIGEWQISFDGVIGDAENIGIPLSAMKKGVNNPLWNFSDVVLFVQVATVTE